MEVPPPAAGVQPEVERLRAEPPDDPPEQLAHKRPHGGGVQIAVPIGDVLARGDPHRARERRHRRAPAHEPVALQHHPLPVVGLELLADRASRREGPLAGDEAGRREREPQELRVGVLQRRPGGRALVEEEEGPEAARVGADRGRRSAPDRDQADRLLVGQVGERDHVPRRGAMTSWTPSSGVSAGYLLGKTRTSHPGPSAGPPSGRRASVSGGVRASLPSQNGQPGDGPARPTSWGRAARAGAKRSGSPERGSHRTGVRRPCGSAAAARPPPPGRWTWPWPWRPCARPQPGAAVPARSRAGPSPCPSRRDLGRRPAPPRRPRPRLRSASSPPLTPAAARLALRAAIRSITGAGSAASLRLGRLLALGLGLQELEQRGARLVG